MTSLEPELWVGDPAAAIDFYVRVFGAAVLHRVEFESEIVAQLGIGAARLWVSNTGPRRFDPREIGGATGRTLLVTTDPEAIVALAAAAGAELTSDVNEEHGWRLARIVDPFGHDWEIGHPVGQWPPDDE